MFAVGLIALLASIVFGILTLVSVIRKNGKGKRNLLIACVMFGLFIAAAVVEGNNAVQNATETVASNDSADNGAAAAKTSAANSAAEDEAAKKTEEEAAAKAKQEEEERKKAEEEAAAKAEAAKPKLELLEHGTESDGFVNYIVGKIRNNTKKEYSYVQVEINLYDEDGAQIGSTLDNMNNLEAGGIWKFKAIVIDDNVAGYKIKDITGF